MDFLKGLNFINIKISAFNIYITYIGVPSSVMLVRFIYICVYEYIIIFNSAIFYVCFFFFYNLFLICMHILIDMYMFI